MTSRRIYYLDWSGTMPASDLSQSGRHPLTLATDPLSDHHHPPSPDLCLRRKTNFPHDHEGRRYSCVVGVHSSSLETSPQRPLSVFVPFPLASTVRFAPPAANCCVSRRARTLALRRLVISPVSMESDGMPPERDRERGWERESQSSMQ